MTSVDARLVASPFTWRPQDHMPPFVDGTLPVHGFMRRHVRTTRVRSIRSTPCTSTVPFDGARALPLEPRWCRVMREERSIARTHEATVLPSNATSHEECAICRYRRDSNGFLSWPGASHTRFPNAKPSRLLHPRPAGLNLIGKKTSDGLDATFGINYVGHFLLTLEMMPLLLSTLNAR